MSRLGRRLWVLGVPVFIFGYSMIADYAMGATGQAAIAAAVTVVCGCGWVRSIRQKWRIEWGEAPPT